MMLKKLAFAAGMLVALAGSVSAQTNYTHTYDVSVEALSEGGVSDMLRLKEKAVLLAKQDFPVIVEGQEKLTNGVYSQTIEAATLAFTDAKIVEDSISVSGGRLSGSVVVTLDMEKSLSLLGNLQEQKQLAAYIGQAVEEIKTLTGKGIEKQQYRRIEQLKRQVETAFLHAGVIDEAQTLALLREDAWNDKRHELIQRWSNEAIWQIDAIEAQGKKLIVSMLGPDLSAEYASLISEYQQAGYEKPSESQVCGISELGLHVIVDAIPVGSNNNRVAKGVEFEFRHYGNVEHAKIFKDTFQIMPCY
jgi:hypothetical protein